MYPRKAPAHANAAERVLFAALERALPPEAECWFQARLPGRHERSGFHADFLILNEWGLLVLEVKGWHARSIATADESRVTIHRGVSNQHPLLQAFRYQAALLELFRRAQMEAVPVRTAAALPFISALELEQATWGDSFPRRRVLLRDDLGASLAGWLAAVPPQPDQPLSPRQIVAVHNLISSAGASTPGDAGQGRLL